VTKKLLARWQGNFWTGLVVVLPGVVSIAVLVWFFDLVAGVTDILLIFAPRNLTHADNGNGPMYWYWSLVAVAVAVLLTCLVGLLARYYFGKRLITLVDALLLRVPLLNKIYGATKQINEAFSPANKSAFRTVVLVEFPHPGAYSLGFITSEMHPEIQARMNEKGVCVFVPTTPNPTGGFLLLVPEDKLTKLQMSVPDAIKYIVSLGSIVPELPASSPALAPIVARSPAEGDVRPPEGSE
jgi:uncharacterized membrane protein